MEIYISKKELNFINDINQEAKHLFDSYFLYTHKKLLYDVYRKFLISSKNISSNIALYELIEFTSDIPEFYSDHYTFNSHEIFQSFKLNKRGDFLYLKTIDNSLYLSYKNTDARIGANDSIQTIDTDIMCTFDKMIDSDIIFDITYTLESMLSKERCLISSHGYKIYLTKQVIPNLKKTDILTCYIHPLEDNMFYFMIAQNKLNDLIIYHIYKAVNF